MPLGFYLAGIAALFVIGTYCLVAKGNMIRLLIGLSILGNAANLGFVALSAYRVVGAFDPLAHAVVIMAIVIEAAVIAVGLTVVMWAYRHYKTLDVRELKRLKW